MVLWKLLQTLICGYLAVFVCRFLAALAHDFLFFYEGAILQSLSIFISIVIHLFWTYRALRASEEAKKNDIQTEKFTTSVQDL
jgi:hypothetical protein